MKFLFGSSAQFHGASSADPVQPAPWPLSMAERARTALASASSVRLGVAGGGVEVVRHVVAVDGSVVLVVGEDSPLVDRIADGRQAALPVQLRAVDVSPIALPERVRGTVGMAGRLRLLDETVPDEVMTHLQGPSGAWAHRPVLRLMPRRVVAQLLLPGAAHAPSEIDLEAWSTARTDPLVGFAEEWVQHVDAAHRDVLAALVGATPDRVRPVSIDRHGIVLRVAAPARHVRIDFERPAACGCDVREAVEALLRAAGVAPDSWC